MTSFNIVLVAGSLQPTLKLILQIFSILIIQTMLRHFHLLTAVMALTHPQNLSLIIKQTKEACLIYVIRICLMQKIEEGQKDIK